MVFDAHRGNLVRDWQAVQLLQTHAGSGVQYAW